MTYTAKPNIVLILADDDDVMAKRRTPVPDSVDGRLLFDLEADPSEERNLVVERPATAAWFERMVEEVKRKGSRNVDPVPPPRVRQEIQ